MLKHDSQLFSLKIEKVCIGGLLKHPSVFAEIDIKVRPGDFYNETHSTIYSVLRVILGQREKMDKVILAQKMHSLGITTKDDIDIFDYIDSLSHTQISQEGLREAFDELVKLRVCRDIAENADKIKEFVHKNKDKGTVDIIAGADSIHNEKIETFVNDDAAPDDLYSGLKEMLYETAQKPKPAGMMTPYVVFDELVGGLRAANGIYVVASRAKSGKSSWLLNMAEGVAILNPGCKVLLLDTEMTKDVSRFRASSAITQVPMSELEDGSWFKDLKFKKQVDAEIDKANNLSGKIFHKYVGGRTIDEVISIARRWYYKECGRNAPAFIVYYYIKLTGEKLGQNWAEYQAIGDKVNKLNELGNQLNVPIFAAVQQNRSDFNPGGKQDSELSIAQSDRISWFCASLNIFRTKTPEEISEHGPKFGNCVLKPLVNRFRGRNTSGIHDLVKIKPQKRGEKPTYIKNFINYNFDNFRISELGTLKEVVEHMKDKPNLHEDGEGKVEKDEQGL
jgi:replicative DNA helicase